MWCGWVYNDCMTTASVLSKGNNNSKVASGRFRLNRDFFDAEKLKANDTNPHRLSLDEKVSRPTVLKYLKADDVDTFSGDVLYAILVSGFGMKPNEIKELRIGDLFEVLPNEEKA